MAFDVLAALVTGIALFLTVRKSSGNGLHTWLAGLFGFFLAGTGLHGGIESVIHAIVTSVADAVRSHVH